MARTKTTAVAVRDSGDVAVAKPQITLSEASALVKKLAADRLREVKDENRKKRQQLEAAIGGHTKRVDDTVVDQAKALMTRLALIVNSQERSYTNDGQNELKKCVTRMGEIVGILQTVMLTSKAVGLFEKIDESDYKGYSYSYGPKKDPNPLVHAGRKVQAEARELLDQYEIIADPAKGKRGKSDAVDGEPQIVTVDELAKDAEIDDDDEDGDDEDGDDE